MDVSARRVDPVQLLWVVLLVGTMATITSPYSAPVLAVLAVNSALVLTRLIPAERLSATATTALLLAGAVAGAALVAVATGGFSPLFAQFTSGHAGFRLRTRPALLVAGTATLLCAGVVVLRIGPGHQLTSVWTALTAGLPVVAGMINRSRAERLRALTAAVEQADRAAQAEAREQILAERGRIARDVHDVLAHSLASINMQLEMADALMDAGQVDRAQEATRRAQTIVRDGMAETQRTVFALRETSLPLTRTLTTMAGDMGVGLAVTGTDRPVPAAAAQALVRVVQESLTNAHKHAPGAPIGVRLAYGPSTVTVEVANGPAAGDRPLAEAGSGMGLVGMRERVTGLGGTIATGPAPDGGWLVRAQVPARD